jgi:hypothetical protein
MNAAVAFVDANVLFSKTLCDWLFLLRVETGGGLFRLVSSEDSITEALYHLRKSRPKADGVFTARRRILFQDSLDEILDSFSGDVLFPGSDENDHHVHAAAVECGARYLIADDLGFSGINPDTLPYEVHTSDSFLLLIAANAPAAIDDVILRQIKYFAEKPGVKSLSAALENAGCHGFGERVREHVRRLATGGATHGISRRSLTSRGV